MDPNRYDQMHSSVGMREVVETFDNLFSRKILTMLTLDLIVSLFRFIFDPVSDMTSHDELNLKKC